MKIVDLNLLLYAHNRESDRHEAARRWLEETLSGAERVALPWIVILGFLRVATSPRVFPQPLRPADAIRVVDSWLAQPQVVCLAPGDEHWRLFRGFLSDAGTAGNLTTDAHLAAMSIEYGAVLCSTDADFVRFKGVRSSNPIA